MIRLIIPEILGDFPRTLRAQEILEDGFRGHFHGYQIIKQHSCFMPPRNFAGACHHFGSSMDRLSASMVGGAAAI